MSISVHGFDDFLGNIPLSKETEGDTAISKIATSWSKLFMLKNNGSVQIWGYQNEFYNKTVCEVIKTVKDVSFLDETLIVSDIHRQLYAITDNNICYKVLFHENLLKDNQTYNVATTEKDLIMVLDDTTCFMCENMPNEIKNKQQSTEPTVKEQTTQQTTELLPELQLHMRFLCSSIAEVSCGKEHVLLLTMYGAVLTFGGGSRGQLGNGTVESSNTPKIVECLAGLKMQTIAAGGWHSVCVSECGDVYCWGWNESGQLGLPSNSVHERHHDKHKNNDSQGNSDVNKEDQVDIQLSVDKCEHNIVPDISKEEASSKNKALDKYESVKFLQNTDSVQIQSIPYLIDLRDEFSIQRASCGSRHTALLSEDGMLLTAGWNDYGQLCQSDRITRDYFETLKEYIKSEIYIKNVYCGPWSTIIIHVPRSEQVACL